MKIKNKIKLKKHLAPGIIFLIFLIGVVAIPNVMTIQEMNSQSTEVNLIGSKLNTQDLGEGLIHDKVHTFYENHRDVVLNPYLLNTSFYHIRFAVVTDEHECHMNLTLIDPNGLIYHIFKSEVPMRFNAYYTVPYGVAVSGNHTIIFTETEGPNLNIHISVSQDDKMPNIPFPVHPDEIHNSSVYLETDTMYKFYISRVSPIAYSLNAVLEINLNLTDPNGIVFSIFNSEPITAFNSPIEFPFGTAVEGFYIMEFKNYQAQPNINILVHIVRIRKISTELNSSDTENQTTNTNSSVMATPFIPPEAFYGGVGIIGIIAVIAVAVGFKYKQKYNN